MTDEVKMIHEALKEKVYNGVLSYPTEDFRSLTPVWKCGAEDKIQRTKCKHFEMTWSSPIDCIHSLDDGFRVQCVRGDYG